MRIDANTVDKINALFKSKDQVNRKLAHTICKGLADDEYVFIEDIGILNFKSFEATISNSFERQEYKRLENLGKPRYKGEVTIGLTNILGLASVTAQEPLELLKGHLFKTALTSVKALYFSTLNEFTFYIDECPMNESFIVLSLNVFLIE